MPDAPPLTVSASIWWTIATVAALITATTALRATVAARGTTAVPATLWAIAACLALALDTGLRAAGIVSQPSAAASLRMATAAFSLCPAMSLLGAKRPQHGVWQLIVAALAMILLLPVLATRLARPDGVPDAHLLGRLFLVGLSLVGWMNFVATRHGPAATLLTLGQLIVVRGFLPLIDSEPAFPPTAATPAAITASIDALGCALAAGGGLLAVIISKRPRRVLAPDGSFARSLEPALIAFRETLGAAWTLRVAERFDAIAASRGWPCRLHFDGIQPADAPIDGPWQRDAQRALEALLKRFVSPAWLGRHAWPTTAGGRLARNGR